MAKYNLSYGPSPAMRYDDYPSKDDRAPIVLFWHGGSWRSGDKKTYRFVGKWLRRLGAHAIVVNYPLFPEQTFPGFLDDIELAIRHIARKYPDRKLFLMGHSAGAHLVSIASMSRELGLAGSVLVSTPCNISSRYYRDIFSKETFAQGLENPINYVEQSPRSVEYFLIHGRRDRIVSVNDSKKLHKKLLDSNLSSQLNLGWNGHFLILVALALGLMPRTVRRLKDFLGL